MRLNERIKKIEEKLALNNPAPKFCGCYEKHLRTVLKETYDAYAEGREADESKFYPAPDFEKGYCDKCQNPIGERDDKLQKDFLKSYAKPDEDIMKMYEDLILEGAN